MVGYHWPEQPKEADAIDDLADNDGIVCVPAVRGEKPAAERLLEILQAAYGTGKMPVPLQEHLQAGKGGTGFQPVQADQFTRRNLPHIQKPGHIYHVTFRTANLTLPPEDRKIVFDACRFWDGKKMHLHACVVMPDHVHLLLTPLELAERPGQFFSLAEILHSIKSYSANQVNRLRSRKGTLWLDESYDRYIRSESDFEEKYWYIANNPSKEGLSQGIHDYPFLYLAWHQQEESTAKMAVPPIEKLLTAAGCKPGTSLDEWLRDMFFEQHCKRFHNRPFIWHIWDGRKDGFSCLVNYHKLNHKLLETLTYSYLQDWITAQAAAAKDGKPGADLRLVAAQELQNKLKLILAGEPPYDIFVRWKPIHEQPIGWNPDLNDGLRINIRPFMIAEVLRKKPSINWSKDRGKEPGRNQDQYPWFWKDGKFTGDRINDYHLTNAQKRAARAV
jgi:REP element-mobilizing transposase RayT